MPPRHFHSSQLQMTVTVDYQQPAAIKYNTKYTTIKHF